MGAESYTCRAVYGGGSGRHSERAWVRTPQVSLFARGWGSSSPAGRRKQGLKLRLSFFRCCHTEVRDLNTRLHQRKTCATPAAHCAIAVRPYVALAIGNAANAMSCRAVQYERVGTHPENAHCEQRAHPDLNQGPADLQSAALTTELCTRYTFASRCSRALLR